MFAVTRFLNGCIALVAALFCVMIFYEGGASAMGIMKILGAVAIFYVVDLVLRRKETLISVGFTLVWLVIYFLGFIKVSSVPPRNEPDLMLVSFLLTFILGTSLFFNFILLIAELYKFKKR